ncbi:DUF1573 domain-containing protein [Telmatocola sphagniphila]|uniref:DUF1573 domain-containing protein n=1 Tax=Telmatocola sphagniphila TaxID=1123043 RepID=A0A8E6ES52_9BACT|nr:DUF1573 domain-containing protein [Telmatocola sphagniphila]QVL30184.1 DUF1573 domain-containing protein [Telmatocola sphagniphila]
MTLPSQVIHERIYLDQPDVFIENARQFESSNIKVKLVNATLQPIAIVNALSSCSCSSPMIEKEKLEPGEYSSINVVFKAGNLQGEAERKIEFICKYKEKTLNVVLKIKAQILPRLKLDKKIIEIDKCTQKIDLQIQPGVIGLDQILEVSSTTNLVAVVQGQTSGVYILSVSPHALLSEFVGHTIVVKTSEPPAFWPRIPFIIKK